uniref:Superkiller protein 3 n=1 Tax=Bartheletia paradoxa TaxID=669517 RepID=A0A2D0XI47_9BASI|nr:hypothetical protein SPAR04661 [Bartheletia paradoxa]
MAAFIKGKLKLAREALGKKDYEAAAVATESVLNFESGNYNALVFSGLALFNLGRFDESESRYLKAIDENPTGSLAWQGLSNFYEKRELWDKYADVLQKLIELFNDAGDAPKCAEMLQKFIALRRSHGSRSEIMSAISLLLPTSHLSPLLSTLPPPDPTAPLATPYFDVSVAIQNTLPTLQDIVQMTEKSEEDVVNKEVSKRRMRLGGPGGGIEETRKAVGREVWTSSKLPSLYDEILNHPHTSDDLRRTTESTLLSYKFRLLCALPNPAPTTKSSPPKIIAAAAEDRKVKDDARRDITELALGMVLIDIPDELAWTIAIEWKDCRGLADYPVDLLSRFIGLFPETPLGKVVRGYLQFYGLDAPSDTEEKPPAVDDEAEDPFGLILAGYDSTPTSIFSHRVLAQVYLEEQDYESTISFAQAASDLLIQLRKDIGSSLSQTAQSVQILLATAYVHFHSPKHHSTALSILGTILSSEPDNVPCLLGKGYVLQAAERWEDAENVFARVVELEGESSDGIEARGEKAWCIVKKGELESGRQMLESVIEVLDEGDMGAVDRARAWWRLASCFWEMGGEYRTNTQYFFTSIVTSLQRLSTFAPAFTSLGIYYLEEASPADPIRASKAFQKAFELDARENEAARRLAEGFADEQEWDLVEVVARRVIEGEGGSDIASGEEVSEKTRYKSGNAWAWKAVGVVELNHQAFQPAITAFQIALRANPSDVHAWLRLGESYVKSGRHVAGLKAFEQARELDPTEWLCLYSIGDVQRQVGQYQIAIDAFRAVLVDRPTELGVLLALAETNIELGRQEFATGFLDRSESSFFDALTVATKIIDAGNGARVAWKLVADASLEVFKLGSVADSRAGEIMPGLVRRLIKEGVDGRMSMVDAVSVSDIAAVEPDAPLFPLELAVGAYKYRVLLDNEGQSSGTSWFDLSAALSILRDSLPAGDKKNACLQQAVKCAKLALQREPENDAFWTLLGHLAFDSSARLAQHAYIKAIEIDQRNAASWSNLGFLYLHHSDIGLANSAFLKSQTVDPEWAHAWVGQALVAATCGEAEKSSVLFEHAFGLSGGSSLEADYGFASRTFEAASRAGASAIENLHSSSFALQTYCDRSLLDSTALHLHALVCERLGQLSLAASQIERASTVLETEYEADESPELEFRYAVVNASLGRIRLSRKDFDGAVEAFEVTLGLLESSQDDRSTEVRLHAALGSGLAHHFRGESAQATVILQDALDGVAEKDKQARGYIAVLLAQTLWSMGGDHRETAKNTLLEAIGVDPECLAAITALAAMGAVENDDDLVDAALGEIKGISVDRRLALDSNQDVEGLMALQHMRKGDTAEALSVLTHSVHLRPSAIAPRRALVSALLREGDVSAAVQTASSALVIQDASGDRHGIDETLRLKSVSVALASEVGGGDDAEEGNDGLSEAMAAVHAAPWQSKNWDALSFVETSMCR